MEHLLIETKDLSIQFKNFVANNKINIRIYSGRIHAIAGENGAGKSTLMKLLYGVYQATEGEIYIDGERVKTHSPSVSAEKGIGMVFQDFRLIRSFTVLENIYLSLKEYGKIFHKKELKGKIKVLCEKYGINVDLDKYVYQLDLGECQQIEILKVLLRENNRLLIFDEPTSALSPSEAERLLDLLVQLKESGYGIIIITHKIQEILKVADEITVLKKGKVSAYFSDTKNVTEKEIVSAMIENDSFTEDTVSNDRKEFDSFFSRIMVKQWTIKNEYGREVIKNAYFDIRPHEILGVAGISGSGQKELAESLIGLRKQKTGELYFDNVSKENRSIKKRKEDGFFWIPEEPKKDIVFRGMTLLEHVEMFNEKIPTTKYGNIDWEKAEEDYEHNPYIEQFRVQEGSKEVASLSGGNIQRMILARAAMANPKFLIASYPSRGLDISTVNMVHKEFIRLRNSGCAILFISEDLDELLHMSDRIVVLYDGKMYGPFFAKEMTYERIGKYMLQGASR